MTPSSRSHVVLALVIEYKSCCFDYLKKIIDMNKVRARTIHLRMYLKSCLFVTNSNSNDWWCHTDKIIASYINILLIYTHWYEFHWVSLIISDIKFKTLIRPLLILTNLKNTGFKVIVCVSADLSLKMCPEKEAWSLISSSLEQQCFDPIIEVRNWEN